MAVQYPMVGFHYLVNAGFSQVSFSEVSGLDTETEVIEYRHSASPEYNKIKMPGMQKFANVTLKRGIMKADNEFYTWLNTTSLNTVERRDITVSLLDENHIPVVSWVMKNAFPIKVQGPTLKSDGNEVAIESIELAHEGLSVVAS
ncbi:MAG: phage tail protein [Flavobacteriales bacterium]|nr:phage tail protein [Flavobacteriales bacterium]PHR36860.1 MAG: phage tail protein [Fluviicola sp.]